MRHKKISSLPVFVKNNLPKHAKEIYRKAYDNAFQEYKDPTKRREAISREATAGKVAWNAVKKEYKKGSNGKWHKK